MSRRRTLYLGIIAVLIAGNVWRWLPHQEPSFGSSDRHHFRPRDFVLYAAPPSERMAAHRDLFAPKRAPAPRPAHVVLHVAPPRIKSPQELASDAARAELAAIKVLGIVIHGDKPVAYVTQGGSQTSIVRVGDVVGGHFTVTAISVGSVELEDTITNFRGRIPVSGK